MSFTYHPELIINAFMPRWTDLGACGIKPFRMDGGLCGSLDGAFYEIQAESCTESILPRRCNS